jgi:hypothetical protein
MNKPLPRLNPLAIIALTRYRDELTGLKFACDLSELVDCIEKILTANKGVHHGR